MKTKLLMAWVALMACICSTVVKAQATLAWTNQTFLHSYPQYQSGTQLPQKIKTATDGSVFVSGTYFFSSNYDRKLCIIKYSTSGDSLASYIDNDPGFQSGGYGMNNYVNDMLMDLSGNVYVLGTTSDSVHLGPFNYRGTSVIYKFNSSLSLLWQATIATGTVFSMIFDATGNICVNGTTYNNGDGTGSNMLTKKFNNQGVEIWSSIYASTGSFDDAGADIASDANGNIYVTGNSIVAGNGKAIKTIKYNSAGQQLWEVSYNTYPATGTIDQAQSIAVSPSGNTYVAGVVNTGTNNYAKRNILVKYDSAGNEKWRKIPKNTTGLKSFIPVKIRLDAQEHVFQVVNRQPWSTSVFTNNKKQVEIRRYTADGKFVWQLVRDTCYAFDFDVTPGGTIYLAGSRGLQPQFNAVKISSTGQVEWEDVYKPVIYSDQIGILGYASCVSINPINPYEVSFGALEQCAQTGSFYSNEWSVRNYNPFNLKIAGEGSVDMLSLNISPNPATDAIYLKSGADLTHARITIYNLIGQSIEDFNLETIESKITVADLKPGIYLLELVKGDFHQTKKFLKQ